jgi:molybdenum cofactor cytidylyltransferase
MPSAAENLKIGCVLMAAGNSRRYGQNKLSVEVAGQPLIRRALCAVPAEQLHAVAVVTQYSEIINAAKEFHFSAVLNEHPELGASRTVALGLNALPDCDGVIFQVADQPLLRRESVAALIALWREHPASIAALCHDGVRGNPCLFPARFFPELLELTGDRGGSAVIRKHPEDILLLEVPAEELWDVDTPEAMNRLLAHT